MVDLTYNIISPVSSFTVFDAIFFVCLLTSSLSKELRRIQSRMIKSSLGGEFNVVHDASTYQSADQANVVIRPV